MTDQRLQADEDDSIRQQLDRPAGSFVGELWYFLRSRGKWWLTPVIFLLIVLGALVLLAGSGAAPFIYTLF